MHSYGFLIIPKEIYESNDESLILNYIKNIMNQYYEGRRRYDKNKLKQQFEDFKKNGNYKHQSFETYIEEDLGYDINEEGEILSKWNDKGFMDGYCIGGRWNGILTKNKYPNNNIKNNSISVAKLFDMYTTTDDQGYNILFNEGDYYTTLKKHLGDYMVSIDYHW
jgi:hypothetical protein